MYGADDLVWRSIVWAARKPFVMQGLPPFVTMRVDDESGPFNWMHVANEFGIEPWAGLFYHNVDDVESADLAALTNAGDATVSIHAKNGSFFYFNHGSGDHDASTVAANFAAKPRGTRQGTSPSRSTSCRTTTSSAPTSSGASQTGASSSSAPRWSPGTVCVYGSCTAPSARSRRAAVAAAFRSTTRTS